MSQTVSAPPIVQRHKSSGQVWRRVSSQSGRPLTGPSSVRIQRDGVQRVVWLAYWRDRETWELIR
jgi:hypothetical protein